MEWLGRMLREREENRKEKKEFQRVVGRKGKEVGKVILISWRLLQRAIQGQGRSAI